MDRIVFLDLETTGLNPLTDDVLEVGIVVTDGSLHEIARRNWVIRSNPLTLTKCPPIVVTMHAESGLTAECLAADAKSMFLVRDEVLQFLEQHDCKGAPLAGNSVGDFDRHFLRVNCAAVNDFLSHRSINVSTFKVLFSMWVPDAAKPQLERGKAHRALADCDAAIAELRHWLKHLPDLHEAALTLA